MLKFLNPINKLLSSKLISIKKFSTIATYAYPDELIAKLNTNIKDLDWASVESEIIEKINFYDADQFIDIVTLIANANKGTEMLWDVLSKKVFDYELDYTQSVFLDQALSRCIKWDHYMNDNIQRNILVKEAKYKGEFELVDKLLI